MISYRFLTLAEEEMIETAMFYEAACGQFGNDFLDDVQRAINRLCDFPYAGELVDSDLRRALLHRFPFSIIYALEENVIVIVAVAHHGRRPGYWLSRVNR
jgi:plasmid stabilization system protein ParE